MAPRLHVLHRQMRTTPLWMGWTTAAAMLIAASAGCVNSQVRLRQGLQKAGLSAAMANCVSVRMDDRLSMSQLRRIGRLTGVRDDLARDGSIDQFLRSIEALGDPEILAVAATSAAACSVTTRGD